MRHASESDGPVLTLHAKHAAALAKKIVSTDVKYTLPSCYYHSQEIYDLERRAIFSKGWFLVTHSARFNSVGDFVQYDLAGFNFVVLKNKSDKIVGFHNICRHRAFPVVQKASGTASIFSCKYHGWSYGLDGRLAKAPGFSPDSTSGFDQSAMNLFPIHIKVDKNGFIYANLDASSEPENHWETQYGEMDQEDKFTKSEVDWTKVDYESTWSYDGHYNWKLMQENYNECYHCSTAHPSIAKSTNLETYFVSPAPKSAMYISHHFEPKSHVALASNMTRFNSRSTTYVFPIGHISPNPGTGFMYLMRCIPTGPKTSRQEYDVFKLHTPNATQESHAALLEFYKGVEAEDVALCNATQKNMERGIYDSGPLHPFREEGVLAFQEIVKEVLLSHLKLEKESGRKIWPARPSRQTQGKEDESAFRILRCIGEYEDLEW